MLGLCCRTLACFSCGERGLLFIGMHGLLLFPSTGSRAHRHPWLWHTGLVARWHAKSSQSSDGTGIGRWVLNHSNVFIIGSLCWIPKRPCAAVFSHVPLCATPRTVAHQAPVSLGFPGQESWSGLPFLPPGELPDPEIQLVSPASRALAGGFSTTLYLGRPKPLSFPKLFSFSESAFLVCPWQMEV